MKTISGAAATETSPGQPNTLCPVLTPLHASKCGLASLSSSRNCPNRGYPSLTSSLEVETAASDYLRVVLSKTSTLSTAFTKLGWLYTDRPGIQRPNRIGRVVSLFRLSLDINVRIKGEPLPIDPPAKTSRLLHAFLAKYTSICSGLIEIVIHL